MGFAVWQRLVVLFGVNKDMLRLFIVWMDSNVVYFKAGICDIAVRDDMCRIGSLE